MIMNQLDSVRHLAATNTALAYPRRAEEVDITLPYFEVYKNHLDRWDMRCYNFENEDNSDRMPFLKNYFCQHIFPNVDRDCSLKGFYNIQLHDSYTYLNDGKDYVNVLTFGKFKQDIGPVLISNIYEIANYGGILSTINDMKPWDTKKSLITFCGTTTGKRDPIANERIQLCLWARDKPWCHFYITKIAQMDPENIYRKIPDFKTIFHNPIDIDTQLNYRYSLNIDGNDAKWDIWPAKTNSLVLKYESDRMLWWYPMYLDNIHFKEVNKDNLEQVFKYYENNQNEALYMIHNSKRFVSSFMKPITTQTYMCHLFESIGNNI
jgi:hypothetical protein